MKESKGKSFLAWLGVLAMIAGVVLATVTLTSTHENKINLFAVSGGLFLLGIVFGLIGNVVIKKSEKKSQRKAEEIQQKGVVAEYIPQQQVNNYARTNDIQTIDEKFEQIAKMDKTQFVVYVAKLFSYNGYTVKLTSVVDNFGVDFLADRDGKCWAVSCLLANKVLSGTDISLATEGKGHYPVQEAMVVTNSYFDRSANSFAREKNVKLVDRTALSKNFMN